MRSNMRGTSSRKKTLTLSILILLLFMSNGYAYLSQSIKLNAVANVEKMGWDEHLENVVVRSGSISGTIPLISDHKTSVTFSVIFKQPNEYYEFYVDVINKGTSAAQLESVFKTNFSNVH